MEQENIDPILLDILSHHYEEKFIGWFWCPHRKDFFRWTALVDYDESENIENEDSTV